jgi:energy-coupling factor transporter ATP-binding protein EcfA2
MQKKHARVEDADLDSSAGVTRDEVPRRNQDEEQQQEHSHIQEQEQEQLEDQKQARDQAKDPEKEREQQKEQERPIVLILGLTGAGKTTFLNHIAGSDLPVAHDDDMNACTATTQTAIATIGDVEIQLVDTPGFDDPNKSEARVLIDVAEWIKDNLRGQRKVTAALYLHSIETTKMYGSNLRNFHLFANLVGGRSMNNVGLVTTHWDTVPRATAIRRESQLSARPWSIYLQHGARTYRAENSRESCRAIARQLLELQPTFLQIQEEMTRGRKALRDTEAGKHVIKEVEQRIQEEREYIGVLKKRLKEVDGEEEVETKKLLTEAEARLERYLSDLEQVKHVPTWGERTVNFAKSQGPQFAANMALNYVMKRGTNMALAGAQSQIETLEEQVATAAASSAGRVLPHSFVVGAGAGSSYWTLEKAFEIGKWAIPKIVANLPI